MEVSKFVMLRKNFLIQIQLERLYILRISKYLELNGLLEFGKKMINFLESICFEKKKKSKMKLKLNNFWHIRVCYFKSLFRKQRFG